MPLTKTTEFGKITVQDKVIETFISDLCQKPSLYDRIWIAQKPNIKANYNEDGDIELAFSVYVRFGGSIKDLCTELADMVREGVMRRTGDSLKKVIVTVSGIRSTSLVRRNMSLEIVYDDENGKTVSISE